MAKQLKNQTISPITLSDLGLSIPASPATFTINPNEFPLFAASNDLATQVTNGNIKVNDGYDDLDPTTGLKHIQQESVPRDTSLITALNAQATANSTLTLTASSRLVYVFTGTVAGQILKLPSALTITAGHRFQVWNTSTQTITVQNNAGTVLVSLLPSRRLELVLQTAGTQAGVWISDGNIFTGVADSLSRFSASCGFDGNASSGRYLEFNSNVDSNQAGFLLPRNTLLKEIALATQTTTTITFAVYKFSGVTETLLTSLVLPAASRTVYTTGLNIQYLAGEEIRVKCTAGAASRPVFTMFMVYN